jgi:hypothetical protein
MTTPDNPESLVLPELAFLRRWRAEAIEVLNEWEQVWEAAGRPGPLGSSKARAVGALFASTPENTAGPREDDR